jgi:hypothetical protein
MITKNFTQDDFLITNAVLDQIKSSPEIYDFHLSLFRSLEMNPLLKWTHETLKNYESLFLTLAVQERTEEFTVNAYYHLLQLATQYEDININWNSALELAQETVKELFKKYNDKK